MALRPLPALLAALSAAAWLAAHALPGMAADAPKKHVLILGDSISMGYTPFVREALKDQAVVVRPEENCEGTSRGLESLDRWLALDGGRWDAIHFNFGLHDLKKVDPATGNPSKNPEHPRQADPEKYATQLRELVRRLKANGARLVLATTTPVPAGNVKPHRDPADVVRYNEIAVAAAKEGGARVDDLYSFALPRLQEIQQRANVHFNEKGYRMLAGEVARHIRSALELPAEAPVPQSALPASRPNIVFVLVDDLGATDLGCTGSQFYRTPNIDRLAAEGMRFTHAYSACTVCSPTRASLLTGKYPARLHITDWIEGHAYPKAKLKVPDWTMHLPLEERTLAEALKSVGYTAAHIGKWHLGGPEFYPDKQGFDRNIGGYEKGQPPSYFSPYRIPTLKDGPDGEFLTDRESAEAVRFITENKDRPFFLYLPHYAVHTPLMGKQEVIARYRASAAADGPQKNATYAALIESVDDSMGRIMRTLDELHLSDKTLVVFTSDNGGLLPITTNLGMRAGKGSAYEGGVRIPLVVRWPGVTKPGSQCDASVITPDHYPTLLKAAGAPLDPGQVVDGSDLTPLLHGAPKLDRDALYWHYPHYHPGGATPHSAIRAGDFRLVEFFEDNRVELYDLKSDPEERHDLAVSQPERAEALRKKLHAWRESVGAQMPTPNPNYQPAR